MVHHPFSLSTAISALTIRQAGGHSTPPVKPYKHWTLDNVSLLRRLQHHIFPMTNTKRAPTFDADPILIALRFELSPIPGWNEREQILRIGVSSIDTRLLCAKHCLPQHPADSTRTECLSFDPATANEDLQNRLLVGTSKQVAGTMVEVVRYICEARQDSFEQRWNRRFMVGQENVS